MSAESHIDCPDYAPDQFEVGLGEGNAYDLPQGLLAVRLRKKPELLDRLHYERLPEHVDVEAAEMFRRRVCQGVLAAELEERGLVDHLTINPERPPRTLVEFVISLKTQGDSFLRREVADMRSSALKSVVSEADGGGITRYMPVEDNMAAALEIGTNSCIALLQVITARARWDNPDITSQEVVDKARDAKRLLTTVGRQGGARGRAAMRVITDRKGTYLTNTDRGLRLTKELEQCRFPEGATEMAIGDLPPNPFPYGCPAHKGSKLFPGLWDRIIDLEHQAGLIERELEIQVGPPVRYPVSIGNERLPILPGGRANIS